MALKRKRSTMEMSATLDDSPQSLSSSLRVSTSPTPCPDYPRPMTLHIDRSASPYQAWIVGSGSLSGEVGSRTRKRHRDDRPNDAIVHRMSHRIKRSITELINGIEHTIDKLFAAQRQRPHATPVLSEAAMAKHNRSLRLQTTLHAFWNSPTHTYIEIFSPERMNGSMETICDLELSRCAHCDNLLRSSPGVNMDIPLSLDQSINEAFGCWRCGRLACDVCAVEMERRVCLDCAIAVREGDPMML